jgi:hypothetical protein
MKKAIYVLLAVLLLTPSIVYAQDFTTWEDLIPYVQQLETRINNLEAQINTEDETASPKAEEQISGSPDTQIGEYTVVLKKFTLAKDSNGEDILNVYFDYTNNSSETDSFGFSIKADVFQNGIEMEPAYFSAGNSNLITKIRPGSTIEVFKSFKLADKTNPVELELSKLIDFSGKAPVLYVLDLSQASEE